MDDPGIMLTILRTEFALLRHGAIDRGFTSHDTWLEHLRQQDDALFATGHR